MAGQAPAWFTPERLLFLFCCMSLLVYLDRGASMMQCETFHIHCIHCRSLPRLPVQTSMCALPLSPHLQV